MEILNKRPPATSRRHLLIALSALLLSTVWAVSPTHAQPPSCSSHAECNDGNACNGVEFCAGLSRLTSGRCAPGPAPICDLSSAARNCVTSVGCDANLGCFCRAPCNNNGDCGPFTTCVAGVCSGGGPACTDAADCASGQVCGSNGTCVPRPTCNTDADCANGVCDPTTNSCVSQCRTNADCPDDSDACTPAATCNGNRCVPGTRNTCSDGNPATNDRCDSRTGACTNTPSRCNNSPIANPTLTVAFPRGINQPEAGRFTLRGNMSAAFRPKMRNDPSLGRLRFKLTDTNGYPLVDYEVQGEGNWSVDARKGVWTYTAPDKKASVQRVTITGIGGRPEHFAFEISGILPDRPFTPDARSFRPSASIIVDWTGDISGPCGAVVVPICVPRRVRAGGLGSGLPEGDYIFCRADNRVVPGF